MASSRLPGKPLLEVEGLPMIEHVRRRALLCGRFANVVVATCDDEIAAVVEAHGGNVVMTSRSHAAATDRVAEAMKSVECTHVVNVQGDEILVLPSDLERMVSMIESEPNVPAWNAVARIEDGAELADHAAVKCAVSAAGRVLFCSRDFAAIPVNDAAGFEPIRRILGIIAYRRDFLERYATLARTPLEIAEGIDQSRIVEHDIALRTVPFSKGYVGINEPREAEIARSCLTQDPVQRTVLQKVLVTA